MKAYLEYVGGRSSKFWEIVQTGTKVTTRWGRIGSTGRSTTKRFPSAQAAKAAATKQVAARMAGQRA